MKELIKQLAIEDIKSIELTDHNEWKWFEYVKVIKGYIHFLGFTYKPIYNYEYAGDGITEKREVISETLSHVVIEDFETNIDITEQEVTELIENIK